MPEKNQYGIWPASGEIDIMESRGNKELFNDKNMNIGVEQVGSTLHYGPYSSLNGWSKAHFDYNSNPGEGFNKHFHVYGLEWTPGKSRIKKLLILQPQSVCISMLRVIFIIGCILNLKTRCKVFCN